MPGTFLLPMTFYSADLKMRFRRIDTRDGVLIEGPAGWAEVSPFWDYDIEESSAWLAAALEIAYLGFPTLERTEIPVNLTVPAVDPERAQQVARADFPAAKIKVGQPGQELADDLNRVAAVRDVFDGAIRIDVNGAWDRQTAIEAIKQLDRVAGGLEYCEQPCASVDDLAAVRAAVNVPIAADESIRRASDPYEVAAKNAADLMVAKVQPIGGIRTCLALSEELDLPVVVSSALESSVGISAGLALAGALPRLDYACGLSTTRLFTSDVTSDPIVVEGGHMSVREVIPDRLDPVPDELVEKWTERVEAMWAHLVRTRDIHELTGGAL